MSYIGNEPIVSATRTVTEVTATAGQTSFTPNGGYTVGFLDVFINGSKLTNTDFTATNGTTVTLNEAAQAGDIVRLEALGTFLTSSAVPLTGGNITGNLNVSGNLGVGTTSPGARLQVSGEAIFGGAGTYQTVSVNNNSTTGGGSFAVQQNGNTRGGISVSGAWLGDTSSDLSIYATAPNIRFYTNNSSSERMRITSGGDLQFNSGYGSVATAYGCRAWVNFNGTGTVAIRSSGNVSSITDNGTGDYTLNFTTAFPDTNYSFVGSLRREAAGFAAGVVSPGSTDGKSTSSLQVRTGYATTQYDYPEINVSIFR